MAQSLWSGALSFGLVDVPVRLHSAVRDQGVHFRQIHEKTGRPIEVRRVCSKEDEEVPWEEIAHGYDLDGEQVVLTDEELAAADPRKTRTIDIEAFVDLEEIDPLHFDHPYVLVPDDNEGAARAYRLLREVMDRTDRVAIGRVVLRTKEYLVAIRVREGVLSLTTMRFADEIRPAKEIAKPAAGKAHAPKKAQLDNAVKLLDTMCRDFDPARYRDEHRERLLALVKAKGKGKELDLPEEQEPEAEPIPDLMAALEASLERSKVKGRSSKRGTRARAAA